MRQINSIKIFSADIKIYIRMKPDDHATSHRGIVRIIFLVGATRPVDNLWLDLSFRFD